MWKIGRQLKDNEAAADLRTSAATSGSCRSRNDKSPCHRAEARANQHSSSPVRRELGVGGSVEGIYLEAIDIGSGHTRLALAASTASEVAFMALLSQPSPKGYVGAENDSD